MESLFLIADNLFMNFVELTSVIGSICKLNRTLFCLKLYYLLFLLCLYFETF